MDKTEKQRAFIIRFLYIAIWAGLIYFGLKYAMPLFMPFVIAFLIAFMLKPLINAISKRVPVSRRVVAVVMLILVYVALGALLVFAGGRLVVLLGQWFGELPRLYRDYVQPAFDSVSLWFDGFVGQLNPSLLNFYETASASISNAVSTLVSSISSGAISFVSGIATQVPWFIVAFFLAIITSFFFVVDYYKITGFIVRQFSPEGRRRLFSVKNFVVNVLFRFVRAYLTLMAITFAELSIGLLILRVPNAVLIAFLTAVVDVLPVFGTGAVMIPWILFCLFAGNYGLALGLTILYVIITIVRQFLEPRVVGKHIGLYPLLTLITMFLGMRLFGFWGLIGFPVTLTVIIYLNREGEITFFKERPAPKTTKKGEPEAAAPPATEDDAGEKEENTGGEGRHDNQK